MNKKTLITITWKSWSWKTTIRKALEYNWFTPIITSTSRKPRDWEIDWYDYNFTTNFYDNDYYLVWKNEKWDKYWVLKDYFKWDKSVLVTGQSWILELEILIEKNIIQYNTILLIYLDYSNYTLIKRLLKRWDSKDSIRNRLSDDNLKFVNFSSILPTLVINSSNIKDTIISINKKIKEIIF